MVRLRAGLEADTKGRTNSSEAFSLKGDWFREEERAENVVIGKDGPGQGDLEPSVLSPQGLPLPVPVKDSP